MGDVVVVVGDGGIVLILCFLLFALWSIGKKFR